MSIAVVTSRNKDFSKPEEIAEAVGVLKKTCKMTWKSCYEIA